MATPKWEFPDTTSPTSTIEFTRGEFLNDVPTPVANQISDESEYGEIKTKIRGPNYYVYPFTVQVPIANQAGDEADISNVETFVKTTVNFRARIFYYTDSDEIVHKVKIMNKELNWKAAGPSYRQFTFILREVE